jgi:hypothetical protein
MVYTAPGMLAAFYLMGQAEVGNASWHDQFIWYSHFFRPFIEAQVVSPALRGLAAGWTAHRAANTPSN